MGYGPSNEDAEWREQRASLDGAWWASKWPGGSVGHFLAGKKPGRTKVRSVPRQ